MTVLNEQPVAAVDDDLVATTKTRRPRHVKGTRPGWFIYACLGVVLLASVFPFYWSLLIGSGDSYTIRDPHMSWIPGGNFFSNAAKVMNDPAVNFWVALWNSIISSGLIALSLLQSNYFVDYSIVLAGVLLATIPLLILFVFAGRQLVSGIMQGAVKG